MNASPFSLLVRLARPQHAPPSRTQTLLRAARRAPISSSPRHGMQVRATDDTKTASKGKSYTTPAAKLNHDVTAEEQWQYDEQVAHDMAKQIRTPWHREGSETPPVSRPRSASAMTKGKLLTTPTRLFKLTLPLTTRDHNEDRKTVEPLALLVHPQQPLSYLERLIQSELPAIKDPEGNPKIPQVNFRAEDFVSELDEQHKDELRRSKNSEKAEDLEDIERRRELRGGPGEGGVDTTSGGTESEPKELVRWSKSTEIGDFIRDAARGKEFAVEIEGAPRDILVGVPSFSDRTYYLRLRLRKKAKQLSSMADVKQKCDLDAEAAAQRVAYMGFAGIAAWGIMVTWLTFMTNLGWDVMEPVTYIVGLVGIMGGYIWFLRNKREASYKAAMNLTVSRRQHQLYQERGFDLKRWQRLVDEGNALRREIIAVAEEYDVEWDEAKDEQDEKVMEALKANRKGSDKGKGKEKKKDDDDEEED